MKTCIRLWCVLLTLLSFLLCGQSAAQVLVNPCDTLVCNDSNSCTSDVCDTLTGCVFSTESILAAPPVREWDFRFGGESATDRPTASITTSDGGYLLGGYSIAGNTGDKTQPSQGGTDYWLVKIDSSGVKQWDFRFGGTDSDRLGDLKQTSDGGYILGGESLSPLSGDRTQDSRGSLDYWVVKINSSGVKQWDVRFGSNAGDNLHSIWIWGQRTN